MQLRLRDKKQESCDIWSFFFEQVDPASWAAGQSIRLEIPRKTWGYDERRFTISSAQSEGHVRITTRISNSEFKQNLSRLRPGDTLNGHNIEGDFIWDNSDQPKLFLAAGIGITPFRAILAGYTGKKDVRLLYQSRDEPPVFSEELAKQLGEALRITEQRLDLGVIVGFCPDWIKRQVYISGPEQMVHSLGQQLLAAGLPAEQLKTDLFTGFL